MITSRLVAPAALVLFSAAGVALGQVSSVNLDFTDPTPSDTSEDTVAETGFDAAINPNLSGFDLTGGRLNITTLPGDTFGQFENDPDSAQNVFFTNFQPLDRTVVQADVTYQGLRSNFHGGGIFLGTDTDHLIRFGAINNGPNVVLEVLRENEDLLPSAPNDIVGAQSAPIGPSGAGTTYDLTLRLIREGNSATAFFSTDGGANFTQVGGTFDAITTGPADGATVEGGFKVGVFAFGGDPAQQATVSFDSFSAVSTVIPEPASLGLMGLAGLGLLRRRR